VNKDSKVSKNIGRLMVAIVIGFALVALYANIQKLRRTTIETVTFIPASVQTRTPSPTPAP
jgi:Na+/proline symporter